MALWINFHNSYFYATLNYDKMLDLMVLTRDIKTLSTVLTFLNTHTHIHTRTSTHTHTHTHTHPLPILETREINTQTVNTKTNQNRAI